MNNDQLQQIREAAKKAHPTWTKELADAFTYPGSAVIDLQQKAFIEGAQWMAERIADPVLSRHIQEFDSEAKENNFTVQVQHGCKFFEEEQEPRTGRIHYGGYRQHTVHYVIADDTRDLIKVSEVSRKIAGDRLVEKQRQMKKDGYEGPFGLPHHCLTHGQAVSFTVDEAGEAVIIFP